MINNKIGLNDVLNVELIESLRLATKSTPILVDFDETLIFRNSTAEYLNNLRPRFIGALLIRLIYFIKPWNWFVSSTSRNQTIDWFLVFLTSILMPWNVFLWPQKAKEVANNHSNENLIRELNKNKNTEVIITSLGFNFIIKPILKAIPIRCQQLIGCKFWRGLKDRQKGKLAIVQETIGINRVYSSIAITDSNDDYPLLKQVALPFLIVWEKAKYKTPMDDIYFPFIYIHKVKRVGQNHFFNWILFDEFPLLIIAFSWISQVPVLNACGILFLLLSSWIIYECGYYENDLVANKYEKKPTLSKAFHEKRIIINWWQPWVWSLVIGGLGVLLVVSSESILTITNIDYRYIFDELLPFSIVPFCGWFILLLFSRLIFFIYNYANKLTRVWLYPMLQISRYIGYFVLMKINIVGVGIILGNVLARCNAYAIYRHTGGNMDVWSKVYDWFSRWLIFIFFVGMVSIAQLDIYLLLNWQTAVITCWWLFRCRKQVFEIVNNIKPIWVDSL